MAKTRLFISRLVGQLIIFRQERFRSLALLKGDASGLGIVQGRDCLIATGSRYHPDLQPSPYYSDTINRHHALPSLSNNPHALFDFIIMSIKLSSPRVNHKLLLPTSTSRNQTLYTDICLGYKLATVLQWSSIDRSYDSGDDRCLAFFQQRFLKANSSSLVSL